MDATPSAEVPQNEAHRSGTWAALADGAAVFAGDAKEWFDRRGTGERLGFAGALLVAWLAWRAWRGTHDAKVIASAAPIDGPLPAWEVLAAALRSRGIVRASDETLDSLARRVERTDLLDASLRDDAAAAIRAYAALRYGRDGDLPAVERRTGDVARAIR